MFSGVKVDVGVKCRMYWKSRAIALIFSMAFSP